MLNLNKQIKELTVTKKESLQKLAGTSERIRKNLFRSVKTLDDLHRAISDLGFKISRSALYNRIQPKSQSSNEGKGM